ncbi:hypothetical protein AMTR_s00067p00178320 [Amborella trichopoda]|uniref:Uncharacterized protein n=1 Tax=Amborella trichopoda TaxID=13333 RepID=U5DES4_AMBTC|nr:hypothetical protein AMTR_s00067p00178320 [Amborella trichopoda]
MNGLDSLMGLVASAMAAREKAWAGDPAVVKTAREPAGHREKVWAGDPTAVKTARGLSRHGDDTCSG